jgi:hypothetical protein
MHKETYLGKKNVLTIGVAYASSKLDLGGNAPSFTFNSWTIDANYEQKFGAFVPKLEAGYVYTDGDNLPLAAEDGDDVGKLDDVKTWYVEAGVLYDQQLWLGKLGLYVKYQDTDVELNNANPAVGSDIEPTMWTVTIPYYLADQNAKIALQWNHYDYDKKGMDPRNANDDTNDDITLAFQVQF